VKQCCNSAVLCYYNPTEANNRNEKHMIKATKTFDNEITLTSTNHLKSVRVYFSRVWGFQNKNKSTNFFENYHEGLEFLTNKGW
jgi:hypothetical protein